ncbi:MAG TPA: hypothetical protein VEL76_13880 [Gemmataceae bacterium]|nr:hypothetical protein [Gemmataceae bacterium]
MPNWCECDLLIEGPAGQVSAFLKQADATDARDFDFNCFIPYPEKYRRPDETAANWDRDSKRTGERPADGYNSGGKEWRLEHWGTKWNAHRVTVDKPQIVGDGARVVIHFSTPYAALIPVVRKASEMYPQLRMDLSYVEETQEFAGRLVCKGGKVLFHERDCCREPRDKAEELWQCICADPSILPDARLDAFDAAVRRDPNWRAGDASQQATQGRRGRQSCQTIPGREPGSAVVVGWDRELQSYFGQVWHVRSEFEVMHPRLSYWVGSHQGEVPSIFALAALMRTFAVIPAATLAQLLREPVRQEPPSQAHHPKLTHEI